MAVITISREMGTGAYAMARELARKLKYTLIDGSKLKELAPMYGLTLEILERVDEKPPVYITAEDRLHAAHLSTIELIILDSVKKDNVILYGRGGQDLLKGMRNVLRVRFIAPFEDRVEKLAEREWIDPDLTRELIRKSDHQRGGFIHFYFNRNWQDPLEYDLIYNTTYLTQSAIVESIVSAVKDPKLKEAEGEAMEILENIILGKRVEAELLRSAKIDSLHFRIEAEKGEVSLSGHVHSEDERKISLKITSKVKGVEKVLDNLQVVTYKPFKE